MRKILMMMAMVVFLSGCGNDKTINGYTYDVYGIANMEGRKNPNIEYEVSIGSVICAFIFCETIIVPVYVLLFDLFQPVGPMRPDAYKGIIR